MHNFWYLDVNSDVVKTAKYNYKDELEYGDDIENRSPASKHLLKVFTGYLDHTTNTEPESGELKLKDGYRQQQMTSFMRYSTIQNYPIQQKQQQ